MVLQGVAGLSGNAGKRNRRGEQMSGAIPQHRKRMLAIGEEGQLFTRKEKSKQNEEKFEQKQQQKNQCFKNIYSWVREKFWKLRDGHSLLCYKEWCTRRSWTREPGLVHTPMARCVVLGSGLCFPICKMT